MSSLKVWISGAFVFTIAIIALNQYMSSVMQSKDYYGNPYYSNQLNGTASLNKTAELTESITRLQNAQGNLTQKSWLLLPLTIIEGAFDFINVVSKPVLLVQQIFVDSAKYIFVEELAATPYITLIGGLILVLIILFIVERLIGRQL